MLSEWKSLYVVEYISVQMALLLPIHKVVARTAGSDQLCAMPEDSSHPPVSNRKRAKSRFKKSNAQQDNRVRQSSIGSTSATSERATPVSRNLYERLS